MRLPVNRLKLTLLLMAAPWCGAASFSSGGSSGPSTPSYSFHIVGGEAEGWSTMLSALGLVAGADVENSDLIVIPSVADPAVKAAAEAAALTRVEQGAILIVEGVSPLAQAFGFYATEQQVVVQSIKESIAPELSVVWETPVTLPRFDVPVDAKVFARERWDADGAPLVAGLRRGKGAVLWLAASPGPQGFERFPYIPQALAELGFAAPFRSARLWAFFDSAYRTRVDLDYFAPRWRAAGIAALHVAAWHYWERDPEADAYLDRLIDACHRNGIQVYAWVELPHVSEQFWADHPEWREKTALGQDAHLDWRKLMNLTNREAFAAVADGLDQLTARFDWDGINLAELYFESLEGHDNPSRFTPMNTTVRAEFQATNGFDPAELFDPAADRYIGKTTMPMARFLDFRAELARRQQTEWISHIETLRTAKPWLDLVLTHVDDRFDTSMREKIGADTAKTLPLLREHDFTFLVEDPATIWNLGPQRYPQIAARYQDSVPRPDKLAIDINIVERYQDVYPTKQQTGVELFELVHAAAASFPRVTLYFESSILKQDLPLLAASSALVDHVERVGDKLVVESKHGVGVAWRGPAMVDGRPWPVTDDQTVWLTPGVHSIQAAAVKPVLNLTDLNAELRSANAISGGMEFAYESSARVFATFDRLPATLEIDGFPAELRAIGNALILPRGQHLVTARVN